jgi:hypothetical protein
MEHQGHQRANRASYAWSRYPCRVDGLVHVSPHRFFERIATITNFSVDANYFQLRFRHDQHADHIVNACIYIAICAIALMTGATWSCLGEWATFRQPLYMLVGDTWSYLWHILLFTMRCSWVVFKLLEKTPGTETPDFIWQNA